MKTRTRSLQALAVIGMAAALGMTARPALAESALICTDACVSSCADDCWPCIELSCNYTGCDGGGFLLHCV
jgi:hypothetical protein